MGWTAEEMIIYMDHMNAYLQHQVIKGFQLCNDCIKIINDEEFYGGLRYQIKALCYTCKARLALKALDAKIMNFYYEKYGDDNSGRKAEIAECRKDLVDIINDKSYYDELAEEVCNA